MLCCAARFKEVSCWVRLNSFAMNADLAKERASATFNIEELTNIIDGDAKKTKWRREIRKFCVYFVLFFL